MKRSERNHLLHHRSPAPILSYLLSFPRLLATYRRKVCFILPRLGTPTLKAPTLSSSRAALWSLSGLADQGSDLSLQMSLAFQVRNHPRLRSFQPTVRSGRDGSYGGSTGGFRNVFNSFCETLRKTGDASPSRRTTRSTSWHEVS